MARIDLNHALPAPIHACFQILADHEGYARFRGITGARLLRDGAPDRNGLGPLLAASLRRGFVRMLDDTASLARS